MINCDGDTFYSEEYYTCMGGGIYRRSDARLVSVPLRYHSYDDCFKARGGVTKESVIRYINSLEKKEGEIKKEMENIYKTLGEGDIDSQIEIVDGIINRIITLESRVCLFKGVVDNWGADK